MFESILSNETEIERLHTKVLLEQLSKTSSNSDLLAAASPSPQFNSGSQGGSSDFNQDHIIQTLMEKPENDSELQAVRLGARAPAIGRGIPPVLPLMSQ